MQSSISGGRWQPRVAGGGAFPFSPPFSPQRSPPFSPLSSIQPSPTSGGRWQPRVAGGGCSALPHRLSHLSSVIDAVIHFRWQVAAPGGRWRVFRPLSSIQPSVICHRCSHPFRVAGGSPGWQVAALFHSALHSVLNAALHSALRDRFSHLSSVIDSVIHSVIHSALPEAARSARGAAPTSRQCPEITKNDEPRTKNSPDQHPLCRDAVPTLPRQTRAARGAAPTQST